MLNENLKKEFNQLKNITELQMIHNQFDIKRVEEKKLNIDHLFSELNEYKNFNNLSKFPLSLKKRIQLALEHIKYYKKENETLWQFMDFSLTLNELLNAAKNTLVCNENLKEKIKKAFEHATYYKQLNNSLWPYQNFSLTIGELFKMILNK